MKSSTHTFPVSTSARGRRRTGKTAAVTSALGLLASTLVRARELPGRLSDVYELRSRLEENRHAVAVRLARLDVEAATSLRLGREFGARRAAAAAIALHDEAADVEAMLKELGRVERRLRREIRAVDLRLAACAALARTLECPDERDRTLELVASVRASIVWPDPEQNPLPGPSYTFIRVDAKQTGHAR